MSPYELAFALHRKHIPSDPVELTNLEQEANKEWRDMMAKEEKDAKNPWERFWIKNGKNWKVRFITGLLYIPASIWLGRQMNSINNPMPNLPGMQGPKANDIW